MTNITLPHSSAPVLPPLAPGEVAPAGPAGWTPATVAVVPSTRKPGMLPAVIDAYKGVNELGNGQALSAVQVAKLAPFLASAYKQPEAVVAADLLGVRLYTGGAAAGQPNMAITVGRDIYVEGASEVERIMSWGYRGWLTHELGHTMQWRSVPDRDARTEVGRMRANIHNYAGALVVGKPWWGPGAIELGVGKWVHENINPFNKNKSHISLSNAVHDSNRFEIEAEVNAQGFSKQTAAE